jgi:hypothetical protein
MNEKERYIKIGQDFIDKMTEQQERRIIEIVDNSPKAGYYKLLAAEFVTVVIGASRGKTYRKENQ